MYIKLSDYKHYNHTPYSHYILTFNEPYNIRNFDYTPTYYPKAY